jgi:hypothetical protein
MLKPLASNQPGAIERSALGPVTVNPAAILEDKGQFFKRARSFKMASHKSLLWKQAFYVSITYVLVIVYGLDLISTGMMLGAVSLYYLRLFNILHQKAHANHNDSIKPQWLGRAIELINIYYLPYQESSTGKLSKHETHHKAHRMHADPTMLDDVKRNPHAVFERYGFCKSFLAALFYEEVMLYLDIRDRGISKDRWMTFLVGSIVVLTLLGFLGWYKFIVFATFYRVSFALSWFGFSYLFHHPSIYTKRIETHVWDSVLKLARWFVGAGAVNSIFYHEHHHRAPQVPSEYLHLLAPYQNTAG